MSATAEFGVRFPASSLKRSRLARRGLASYPPPGSSHARRDRSKVDTVVALARTRSRRPTGDTTPRDLSRGPPGRCRQRIAVPSRRSSTPTARRRVRACVLPQRSGMEHVLIDPVSLRYPQRYPQAARQRPRHRTGLQGSRRQSPRHHKKAALPSPPPSPVKPPLLRRLDALTDLVHRSHGLLLGPDGSLTRTDAAATVHTIGIDPRPRPRRGRAAAPARPRGRHPARRRAANPRRAG
jgi:hypothetical protein